MMENEQEVSNWRGVELVERPVNDDDLARNYGIARVWTAHPKWDVRISHCPDGPFGEWLAEWCGQRGWGKTVAEAKNNCNKACVQKVMTVAFGIDLCANEYKKLETP